MEMNSKMKVKVKRTQDKQIKNNKKTHDKIRGIEVREEKLKELKSVDNTDVSPVILDEIEVSDNAKEFIKINPKSTEYKILSKL